MCAIDGPLPIGDCIAAAWTLWDICKDFEVPSVDKNSNSSEQELKSDYEKAKNLTPEGAGRRGALREAKRRNRIPTSQPPEQQGPNHDRKGKKQPVREYTYKNTEGKTVKIRDDSKGHQFKDDPSQNRGPHFNDETKNHYEY